MTKPRKWVFWCLILTFAIFSWPIGQAVAKNDKKGTTTDEVLKHAGKKTNAEKKAAAAKNKSLGQLPGVAGVTTYAAGVPLAGQEGPGGTPHYFGPYANWAYSPLPRGPVAAVTVVDGGTGYSATPIVEIADVYGTGSGATATATVSGGIITGITFSGGADYSAPIVTITDSTGTGATATATIGGTLTGGIHKFINNLPLLDTANNIGQLVPVAVPDKTAYPPGGNGYTSAPTVTITDTTGTGATATATVSAGSVTGVSITNAGTGYSDKPVVTFSGGGATTNAMGRAAVSGGAITGITLIGSDYYEIELGEYSEQLHTDLPPTKLRGYRQTNTTGPASNFHYSGPLIICERDKPVRVKFTNKLPIGTGGNLFLPVDKSIPGAGAGPNGGEYTQNRAAVHLHGNNTVWMSDGTPHQWITPAGESTAYPQGVSVRAIPDMGSDTPTDGQVTLYYTNGHSARLMFYHDHALAITRINVYAGVAAGYLVTDDVDKDMINGTNNSGVNPDGLQVLPDEGIPLIIQDKTFVDATTIFAQDPTWNWGTGPRDPNTGNITGANTGDLWSPHVYMSAQNPWDLTGTNAFGRWHYGPWFWPSTPTCDSQGLPVGCINTGPQTNPYFGTADWEPPLMPGTPNPSMPGEAFNDTPVVNGTLYPYMEVEPRAYRFRILNAANDRMFNLQLYVAADKTSPTTAGSTGTTIFCDETYTGDLTACTEVRMIPVGTAPNQMADWPSGIPDPAYKGPNWIQIGSEGGFLPAPVEIPSQPIGWNLNPTTFNYGNVNQHSLLLGCAERADVVVDFSAYQGKTLILYNDAPAAFPAGVPSYDYFTGSPDQMDTGGAPTTQPGYGPNTRTVMQIRVGTSVTTQTPDVTLANLNAVFAKNASTGKRGVFEASQDPIVLPQAAYNSAYDAIAENPSSNGFPTNAVGQYVSFVDSVKSFQPIDETGLLQAQVTIPLEPKAMHDEMGGVYDRQFGRMSGMLGLTDPTPNSTAAPFLAYGLASPPTDIHLGAQAKALGMLPDGTQIWKITHNGVDTHPVHVHLFNAQLINRIAMDGIMLPPDPNELGWKETIRINPLEHIIIAMRPTVPTPAQVPFEVPNSVRLIDPSLPPGVPLEAPPPAGWFDPAGNPINEILNHTVNFGWEYVWHCHILAHEEMDMMHALAFAVPPKAPTGLTATISGNGGSKSVVLNWNDTSLNETNFVIQKSTDSLFSTILSTFTTNPNIKTYTDKIGNTNQVYYYRVLAVNAVGDVGTPGFPVKYAYSDASNVAGVNVPPPPPAAPTGVNVTCSNVNKSNDRCTVTWSDASNNETGFRIPSATNSGFTASVTTSTVGANTTTFTTGNLPRNTVYYFHVQSYNAGGASTYVNASPSPVTTP